MLKKCLVLVFYVIFTACDVYCYNVDTKFPVIYVSNQTLDRQSYFGYTVLLHTLQPIETSWIQIGAPRSNSSFPFLRSVKEPGVVHRCLFKGTCTELKLEEHGNGPPEATKCVNDNKDYAWIGGAMAAESGQRGRVAICGHRWKNVYINRDGEEEYHIPGICYWLHAEEFDNVKRLTPTVVQGEDCHANVTFQNIDGKKLLYFAMSQAGISIDFIPENKDSGMIVGTPGLMQWIGGMAQYENADLYSSGGRAKRSELDKNFKDPDIVNPIYGSSMKLYDMLGYQVASGKFFSKSESVYAASAPRGNGFTGYVKILRFPKSPVHETDQWTELDKRDGKEMGEYFGYSMTVGDITGDGLDDLIVGAPMYSHNNQKRDAGRIFVFFKSKLTVYDEQFDDLTSDGIIEGDKVDARFGSAVMSIGDIDQDHYYDIAVGAPYEDEGRGAIYIYNGSPKGLIVPHSQHIRAAEVDEGLRGFGISISPPADLDGNGYYDVAVGAYLSGHAVVFRSYPVVKLNIEIKPQKSQIMMNDTRFNIQACQKYSYSNAPPSMKILRNITVDERYKRATLNISAEEIVELKSSQWRCDTIQLTIQHRESNWHPIEIRLSQKYMPPTAGKTTIWIDGSSPYTGSDHFCSLCPVINKDQSQMETSINIPYNQDCKGTICMSNLSLSCGIYSNDINITRLNGSYVMGSLNNHILYVMNITNSKEPAYTTYVNFTLPKFIHLAHLPQDCQEIRGQNNSLFIICDIRTPVKEGIPASMELVLDTSGLLDSVNETTLEAPDLIFESSVNSSSGEIDMNDNLCKSKLKVKIKAVVHLTGTSEQPIYTYPMLEDPKDIEAIKFAQIYKLNKTGESPMKNIRVQIKVPMKWKTASGENIPFLSNVQVKQSLKKFPCKHIPKIPNTSETTKSRQEPDLEPREKKYDYPSNRSLYLNCSNNEIQCDYISCTIDKMTTDIIDLSLEMVLNVSLLVPHLKGRDIIYISTTGYMEYIYATQLNAKSQDLVMVSSIFKATEPTKEVAIWIYIISIIIGLILIFTVVAVLVKTGFFKREKKDELQALRIAEGNHT